MAQHCIVVVERDPDLLRLIRVLLAREGLGCEAFECARKAGEWLSRDGSGACMVVVDLDLQDDRAVALLDQADGLPMVRLSSEVESVRCTCGADRPCLCLLAKPFSPPAFIMAVKARIARQFGPMVSRGPDRSTRHFVLDLCSGTGYSAAKAADAAAHGTRVVAADRNAQTLQHARELLRAIGYSDLLFVVCEVEALPFRDASIHQADRVEALERWLSSPEAVAGARREVGRVLGR